MSKLSRVFVLALATFVSPSFAVTFGFNNITNNSGIANALASEFALDVTASGANVMFTFSNNASGSTFINQIYWDDKASILNGFISLATGYSAPASPANLPAGNTVGFTANFSADGNPPAPVNGINAGDTGSFTLSLLSGVNFDDVIAAMSSGSLRLGIHAQGIKLYDPEEDDHKHHGHHKHHEHHKHHKHDKHHGHHKHHERHKHGHHKHKHEHYGYQQEYSESFVASVPEPSTYLLFGLGLATLMLYRKRRVKA